MKKVMILISILVNFHFMYSQKVLMSWGQQNIEGITKEKYDDAQTLTSDQLLEKNLNDTTWCDVFLTLNASVNHQSKNQEYLKGLVNQITNSKTTNLRGTSKLIIWDRIISNDILFEGKGLVVENDLFVVAGRANQLLQNLTLKNFGYVNKSSTEKDLVKLKNKWIDFLSGKSVDEYKTVEYKNAKIPEINSLKAVEALIISIQDNQDKKELTKKCLKKIYKLDEMPKEKGPEIFCDPNTHSFAYLSMLFGDKKRDETKDAKWWKDFWATNHNKFVWNDEKGFYEIKN
ncbi:hypothetical protein [Chryseobacterium paridis]|nr:hypothetical protein [Chryseobacterium paridis]